MLLGGKYNMPNCSYVQNLQEHGEGETYSPLGSAGELAEEAPLR